MPLPGHELAGGETTTRGLDNLAAAAARYRAAGARFAKWRAALRVDAARGFPSDVAVATNATQLARYAAVCQAAGLVPIVEPELLMEGNHSAAEFGATSERVIGETIAALWREGVQLEGCLLKPQMIIAVRGAVLLCCSSNVAECASFLPHAHHPVPHDTTLLNITRQWPVSPLCFEWRGAVHFTPLLYPSPLHVCVCRERTRLVAAPRLKMSQKPH